jgi:hypothetical protein
MNTNQLKRGTELMHLIKVTVSALDSMQELQNRQKVLIAGKDYQGKAGFIYNFAMAEHSDGSGISASLPRYEGNQALVDVIVAELKRQLDEFTAEFEML